MHLSGKDGRVTVAGRALTAHSWRLTMTAAEEDVTCAYGWLGDKPSPGVSGYGYQEFVSSLPKLGFEVEAHWDTRLNPFDDAIKLYAGQVVRLVLYHDKNEQRAAWDVPRAVITRADMSVAARGLVGYSFAGVAGVSRDGVHSPFSTKIFRN